MWEAFDERLLARTEIDRASRWGTTIDGSSLIDAFVSRVEHVSDWIEGVRDWVSAPRMNPWPNTPLETLPPNIPLYLMPILLSEVQSRLDSPNSNPRIHFTDKPDDKGNILHLNWVKPLAKHHPTIVLDGTASPYLIDKMLTGTTREDHNNRRLPGLGLKHPKDNGLPLPDNVKILQYADAPLWKSTLVSESAREKHCQRLLDLLDEYPKDMSIGVATSKGFEEELESKIRAAGFSEVAAVTYGDLRSNNLLRDVDILVVFGAYVVNVGAMHRMAQAIHHDEIELSFAIELRKTKIPMKSGGHLTVELSSYPVDDRLSDVLLQTSITEMKQALHRARPLSENLDKNRIIILYTNLPLPNLQVDRFFGRLGDYALTLSQLLEHSPKCTARDVVRSNLGSGCDEKTLERRASISSVTWIRSPRGPTLQLLSLIQGGAFSGQILYRYKENVRNWALILHRSVGCWCVPPLSVRFASHSQMFLTSLRCDYFMTADPWRTYVTLYGGQHNAPTLLILGAQSGGAMPSPGPCRSFNYDHIANTECSEHPNSCE